MKAGLPAVGRRRRRRGGVPKARRAGVFCRRVHNTTRPSYRYFYRYIFKEELQGEPFVIAKISSIGAALRMFWCDVAKTVSA